MYDKDLGVVEFLDLYGDILDDRQHQIIDMYYNEDYSLSEISEITGITRQGVRDSIKKSSKKLYEMEERLHLKSRIEKFEQDRDALIKQLKVLIKNNETPELLDKIADGLKKLSI